jgi:glycerol uptake facilitator protein
VAMCVTKRMPWAKAPHYILGQFLGAFAAAGLTFAVYYPKWIQVDANLDHTAGIFCTFPAVPGFWPGFFDQVVGTALLLGLILAVVDKLNAAPGANLSPLIIGLIVVAIGMSFGGMNGYAINPARDFGPRLFSVLAGFKNNGLTDGTIAWLPPIIGPLVGGVLGALAYDFTIGRSLIAADKSIRDPQSRPDGMDASHHEHEEVVNRVTTKTL